MTALITLTTAGADTGPYNLYSDVDGYLTPFETGITRSALLAGYTSTVVPLSTVTVRVVSNNLTCNNHVDLTVVYPTTTTSTTAAPTTTTTTTSGVVVNTYLIEGIWEVDDPAHPAGGFINYINASGTPVNVSGLWIVDSFTITAQSIGTHAGVTITLIP